MNAKRCDCCGTYYQIAELRKVAEQTAGQMNKYRTYERTKPLVGIQLTYENDMSYGIDLCPQCMNKIINILGGEQSASSNAENTGSKTV